jgi:Cu(I)/Ag(I) efflux system membrane protein CusA/SilA
MLLFLDLAYDEAKAKGRLRSMADLHEAIVHGAVKRLRPKMMTVTAAMIGLMPIMWSIGTGADVMKRVAAPMVGGHSPRRSRRGARPGEGRRGRPLASA